MTVCAAAARRTVDPMKTHLLIPILLLVPGIPVRTEPASGPAFTVMTGQSKIRFSVKASVSLNGEFEKWDATLAFASSDPASGVLDIKIQAASVNTGSGMKDSKLKDKDFFDVNANPYITFKSTKFVPTGSNTFDVNGIFTIRGVSKPETVAVTLSGAGTGFGEIKGQMAFDRREFGMTSGIPFIKVADRVEVTLDLKVKRASGPALDLKK